MRYILLALIVVFMSGCDKIKTGWSYSGYRVVTGSSYLKVGGISDELMLNPRLNGINYDDRKFDIDILEPDGIMVGVYYSKRF